MIDGEEREGDRRRNKQKAVKEAGQELEEEHCDEAPTIFEEKAAEAQKASY